MISRECKANIIVKNIQNLKSTLPPVKLTYRPDIEGLRAIAVLSVVFFHADFKLFSGGYVGVDIFFVISGFLITHILRYQLITHGKINYREFYAKRIRRLFPALLSTLIITTIFAIGLLSSPLLTLYGYSLSASVASVSNIYFYTQSGYFDISSNIKPLLHTWSLAVEEQFYLVWPWILFLIYRYKHLGDLKNLIFISIIGLISLAGSQYFIENNPSAAFFIMPLRIFEFTIGASICYLDSNIKNKAVANLLQILGFILIGVCVFYFDEITPFPGILSLIPCLGAALLIVSGNSASWIVNIYKKIGFIFIGKISYSLYLVHWPIIVLWSISSKSDSVSTMNSWALVLTSIIIGSLNFYVVEWPIRKSKISNQILISICSLLGLCVFLIGISISSNDFWSSRPWKSHEILTSKKLQLEKDLRFVTIRKICEAKGWEHCDSISTDKLNVLIIGDSHAPDALNALEKQFPNFNYVLSTLGGCPPYLDILSIVSKAHPDINECITLNKKRHDIAYLKKFDMIVINNMMDWYTPKHVISYLKFLHANGIRKVIVFGNYLVLEKDMSDLLNSYGYNESKIRKMTKRPVEDDSIEAECNLLNYLFISKQKIFCEGTNCKLFNENKIPFTYDQHHLSYEFSTEMLVEFKSAINDYIKK